MPSFEECKDIIIVGAGVAGLSNALWIKREFPDKNVTVYDQRNFESSRWNPAKGGDTASSDYNKIMRASYGSEIQYQRMAYEGREIWKDWNRQIKERRQEQLPEGLAPGDEVYMECGFLRLPGHEGRGLAKREVEGLVNLEKESKEWRSMAYLRHDANDIQRASAAGWGHQLTKTFESFKGPAVLDTTAGVTVAHRACNWAYHLAKEAGVKFIFGPALGSVTGFLRSAQTVCGILTADGKSHQADKVIVCGGPWTAALVPECAATIEATAGSVVAIQLPVQDQDLMEKYAPERFPSFAFGLDSESTATECVYGFPRNENGIVKIGYRGVKWTNFPGNSKVSIPITVSTSPSQTALPSAAVSVLKRFISRYTPELADLPRKTRLCWYNDSDDNNLMIDYVPNTGEGLCVCCGGSGHMFKFLPILGKHVIKALKKEQTEFTPLWKYRIPPPGHKANGLEDGAVGPRAFEHLRFIEAQDWVFDEPKL